MTRTSCLMPAHPWAAAGGTAPAQPSQGLAACLGLWKWEQTNKAASDQSPGFTSLLPQPRRLLLKKKKNIIWNDETTIKYCFSLHRHQIKRWSHTGPLSRHFLHSGDFWSLGFARAMSPNAVSVQEALAPHPSNSRTLNKAGAVQKPGTALAAWQALGVRGRIKDKSLLGRVKGWSCWSARVRWAGDGKFGDEQ